MATFTAGMIEGLFKLKDEVTPTLKQLEKTTKEVTRSMERDLGVVSVKKLGEALKQDVGGVLSGGLAVGAAAVAGSLALATRSMLEMSDSMSNLSASTGIGVESLQKFGFVGQAVGVDVEQIAGGMQKFQRNLVEGAKGTTDALNQLGLSRSTLANMLPEDQLQTVLGALNDKIPNAANRTQIAMELLGKSGAALIPLGSGISEVMARAEELGVVMSASDVAAADALGDSVGALGMTFGGLVNTIGSVITSNQSLHTLVGGLQDIVASLTKGVKDNRSALQDWVSNGVEFLISGLILMVDMVGHAIEVWNALKVTWLSAQNVAGSLSIALASAAKVNLMFQGDQRGAAEAQKMIDQVKEWKLGLSDAANASNEATGRWQAGVTTVRTALEGLQGKIKDAHGATVEFAGSTNKSTVELKAEEEALKAAVVSMQQWNDHLAKSRAAYDEAQAAAESYLGMLGPSADEATVQMERLADVTEKLGGVSDLTDAQLVKLVESVREQASLGGDSAAGWSVLSEAMDEAANRSEAVAEAVGFATTATNGLAGADSKLADEARKAAQAHEELLGLVGVLGDVFSEFGLHALASVADGYLAGAQAAEQFARATTVAGKAAAVGQGAMSALKGGSVLGGAATGAAMGAAFGPIGMAVGAVAGGILGFIGKAKKAREEMKKLTDSFVQSAGGMDALKQKAQSAGVSLDAMFKAKNAKALESAIAGIKSKLDLWDESHQKLQAAVEKYGFTIEELGPKFKQQALDEMAGNLIQDFRLLTASGIDQTLVLQKMGPAFNDYVQTAIRAGVALPEVMRPMIEQLIASGQLLDANGNAFTSVEQAGLSFTETLTEGLTRLIDKIDQLVSALTGVGSAASSISIPGGVGSASHYGDVPDRATSFADGTHGFMDFGAGTRATLHGVEAVVPAKDWRHFAGPGGGPGGGDVRVEISLQTGDVLIPPGSSLDPNQVAQAMSVVIRNDTSGLASQILEKIRQRAA